MSTHKPITAVITVMLVALSALVIGTLGARADAPPYPWGVISVTPNTGLTDGQTVQVSGSEFQSNRDLRIVQCGPVHGFPPKGGFETATCSNYSVDVTTDDNGNFAAQNFTVSTTIVGFEWFHGQNQPATYDCLPANDCHIHVFAPDTGTGSANQDITFNQ
jgi:hypothetical protein